MRTHKRSEQGHPCKEATTEQLRYLWLLFVQVSLHLGHVRGDALGRAVNCVRLGRLPLAYEAEALARRRSWLQRNSSHARRRKGEYERISTAGETDE